ncbi:MAG: bifunctional DNA-formamidopyrimidine glycosylase/DNA-(apurinic or apyrimidinic site) lyase [Gemmatimonadaceae bacterium]|nr:bifunctional DNA-formamidopyrimidine glycosylase/DNA-(apurinic or apyrimidinic site) lyase [Gemmatimonadaceae bacterium]
MPELPEVEYAAQRLKTAVLGHTLNRVRVLHPATAKYLTPAAVRALVGRRVDRIERRAKIQLVHLDDGSVLEVHFRMTGDWEFSTPGDEAPRFERVRLETQEGAVVSFVDSRALGVVRWHAPGEYILPPLGPEPLTEHFTVESLQRALASRRAPIKPVLLDQRVVSGVGNIYASEALWVAKINPNTIANTITKARLTRLRDAIREVLNAAGEARYYGTQQDPNNTSEARWRVYDREGEECIRCGSAIARIVQAARSTYFCRRCQKA